MTTLPLAVLLALPCVAPSLVRPQEAQISRTARKDELVLKYFTPAHANSAELADVARELFGPTLPVALGADEEEYIAHFISLGPTLVVQDGPKNAERILETLRQLDVEIGRGSGGSTLARLEYSPRHVGLQSLLEGLATLPRLEARSVAESHMVVLSGAEDSITAARELVARIDVPAPQVLLTCHLIRGLASGTSTASLPRELVDNLKLILPMQAFELVSLNAVQAAVRGQPIRLATEAGLRLRYELNLQPEVYDAEQSTLSLSHCVFELTDETQSKQYRLETGLDLRAGEFVVLGALGDEPLFVVLRVAPTRR
jgi:hypothetical protein